MKPEVGHIHDTQPPSDDVAKSTRLFRRKNSSTWYYRQRIPSDLIAAGAYGKKKEVKISLKTSDKATATRLADTQALKFASEWDAKRLELGKASTEPSSIKVPSKRSLSSLSSIEQEDLLARFFIEMEMQSVERGDRETFSNKHDLKEAIKNVGSDYDRVSQASPQDGWEHSTRDFLKNQSIEIDDESALQNLTDLYQRAYTENLRRTYASLTRNHTDTGDAAFRDLNAGSTLISRGGETTLGKTIRNLCEDFREAKANEDIGQAAREKHQLQFQILTDYFGANHPLAKIRPSDARKLAVFLSSIPLRSNQLYPKKKFTDAAKIEAKRDNPRTLSPKTQRDYFEGIVSIFSHAVDLEFISSNPFKNKTVSKAIPKVTKRKKETLTQEDMARIFNSPDFCSQQHNAKTPEKSAARFWVTLLCLFHGLRSNEAAQLLVEDIKDEDGIAYCYIRETNDTGEKVKHLKTASSERKIPIHEKLLKMDFLDYVDGLRQKEELLLFPVLSQNKRGSKSDLVGKWFSGLRNKLLPAQNFGQGDKTLHSMRHGMNDALRNAGVSEELRKAVGGWKKSGSSSESDYGQGFSLAKLKEVVDKIQYPEVDFSHFYSLNED